MVFPGKLFYKFKGGREVHILKTNIHLCLQVIILHFPIYITAWHIYNDMYMFPS